jgi:hypothetical protein
MEDVKEKKKEREKKSPWMMIDILRTESINGFFFSLLRSNIVTNEKKRKNSRDYISFWQRTNLVFFFFVWFRGANSYFTWSGTKKGQRNGTKTRYENQNKKKTFIFIEIYFQVVILFTGEIQFNLALYLVFHYLSL